MYSECGGKPSLKSACRSCPNRGDCFAKAALSSTVYLLPEPKLPPPPEPSKQMTMLPVGKGTTDAAQGKTKGRPEEEGAKGQNTGRRGHRKKEGQGQEEKEGRKEGQAKGRKKGRRSRTRVRAK